MTELTFSLLHELFSSQVTSPYKEAKLKSMKIWDLIEYYLKIQIIKRTIWSMHLDPVFDHISSNAYSIEHIIS